MSNDMIAINSPVNSCEKKRNYGIDLLRLISMFMVVVLHVLGKGGALGNSSPLTVTGEIIWVLEICCYCAVNVYAIISGYVGIKSKHKYSNLISLCVQLMFYSILITGIEILVTINNGQHVNIKQIVFHIFPSIKGVWYFSAYFCLFFFMPILNIVIEKTPAHILKTVAIFIFLVFCCWGQVMTSVANLSKGYSVFWLAILYVVGGCIAKYNLFEKLSFGKCILGYFICVGLTVLSRIVIGVVTSRVFGSYRRMDLLVSYTSPTIVFSAVFLVVAFAKLNLGVRKARIVSFLSPMSFGVYLIHCHPFVFGLMTDKFSFIAFSPFYLAIVFTLVSAMIIFLLCVIIDWLRIQLFKVLKIKKLVLYIEKIMGKIFRFIINKLKITSVKEQN